MRKTVLITSIILLLLTALTLAGCGYDPQKRNEVISTSNFFREADTSYTKATYLNAYNGAQGQIDKSIILTIWGNVKEPAMWHMLEKEYAYSSQGQLASIYTYYRGKGTKRELSTIEHFSEDVKEYYILNDGDTLRLSKEWYDGGKLIRGLCLAFDIPNRIIDSASGTSYFRYDKNGRLVESRYAPLRGLGETTYFKYITNGDTTVVDVYSDKGAPLYTKKELSINGKLLWEEKNGRDYCTVSRYKNGKQIFYRYKGDDGYTSTEETSYDAKGNVAIHNTITIRPRANLHELGE